MKLLRCHIENFGVLQNFDFDFSPGLTVICEGNGFGKSTFAAFIKAMFYGLPGRGRRSITENERRRYEPWQGGKYGGFLEFEYQGIEYRVTRYFGKTASKDTFEMMDLTNRQSRTAFSEKLGEELFQLDAESFARSTYIPQLSVHDVEATTSIRAKLGNLVDDTNDMNNFDTAAESLRKYRSRLRAYRGSGGAIDKLEEKYQALENQKFEAVKKKPSLQEVSEQIEQLDSGKTGKNARIADLRNRIRISSDQKAALMLQSSLKDLRAEADRQKRDLQKLDGKYPAGYPAPEEIRQQRENLSRSRQASQHLQSAVLSEKDRAAAEECRALFPDPEKASKDIDDCARWCNELTGIQSGLDSQMLPEEQERLERLSVQFRKGVPSEEELQGCLEAADEMETAQRQLSDLKMPAGDQERLDQLTVFFRDGVPSGEELADYEESRRSRDLLLEQRESLTLSEKEEQEYRSLQRTFASGVPEEQEIRDRQRDCRRITELKSRKETKTARIEEKEDAKQPPSGGPAACGAAGAALLVIGIVCFVLGRLVPGIILLVGGFAGLLAAFWLGVRRMVGGREKGSSVITASAITDAENQELYDLQRSLGDFLLRYYPDASDPENRLVQLFMDRKNFVDLSEKKAALEADWEKTGREIEEQERRLRGVFERYYPGEPYREDFVQELREACRDYEELNSRADRLNGSRKELSDRIGAFRAEILQLLRRYDPVEIPADLRQGVRALASDAASYSELSRKKEKILEENAEGRAQAEELKRKIQGVLAEYGAFDPQKTPGECLQVLRKHFSACRISLERAERFDSDQREYSAEKQEAEKSVREFLLKYRLSGNDPAGLIEQADNDVRRRTDLETGLGEAEKKLQNFLAENPGIEQQPQLDPEEIPDTEALQEAEKKMQDEIDEIDNQLRGLRQERDSLRREVEKIPELSDQMARIDLERKSAEKKCELAGRTLELLNQAKDNLADSYVGKVERGFEKYAGQLLEGQLGNVIVDKDLNLMIDEKGEAREVGSFSAGTVDSIMLCMRLSLVDALFAKEKPFLILDDSFVNLDDEHTERALEILDKVSQSYQVVYLACSSSRCPAPEENTSLA